MKEKSTERLNLRVTKEQKTVLDSLASAAGLSMTAYILYKVGEAAGDEVGKRILQSARQNRHSPSEQQERIPEFD